MPSSALLHTNLSRWLRVPASYNGLLLDSKKKVCGHVWLLPGGMVVRMMEQRQAGSGISCQGSLKGKNSRRADLCPSPPGPNPSRLHRVAR